MNDKEKNAYRTVMNGLMECDLFVGTYDARNGNKDFMYGILTVMEFIADRAGLILFDTLFTKNMMLSEDRAKGEKE